MSHALLPLLLSSVIVSAPPKLEPGVQLTYQGTVRPVDRRQENPPGKQYVLTLTLTRLDADGARLLWSAKENGHGARPWTGRFGRMDLDARLRPGSQQGPSLLYIHDPHRSVVPLVTPLLKADRPLAKDLKWTEGRFKYHVEAAAKHEGARAWRVDVNYRIGFRRKLTVWRDAPLVLAIAETIFLGSGREHRLDAKLTGHRKLSREQLAKEIAASDALIALRDKLGVSPRAKRLEWSADARKTLASDLPATVKAAAGTTLADVTKAAGLDLEFQSTRGAALARMQAKHEGSQAPKFELSGLRGAKLATADLAGKVTVLHFWSYRNAPLREPYGQVGYLDFLSNRRKAAGAKVYGIAVNGQLANAGGKAAALRSVRKFTSFMNLSYPVLIDEGSVLKQFGDPRIAGAKLPLVVVINKQGKIIHHHVGFYKADRNEGLKELDAVVGKALEGK